MRGANASEFEQNTTNWGTRPHSLLALSSLKTDTDWDSTRRMCGVDVDLEDEGAGEEEREAEEFVTGERVRMLPPPPAHSEAGAWGARRGPLGRLAWGAGLLLWSAGVAALCALVLAAVFALVLLPAALLLCAGFLCHHTGGSGAGPTRTTQRGLWGRAPDSHHTEGALGAGRSPPAAHRHGHQFRHQEKIQRGAIAIHGVHKKS
ncbi:hypothetical protein MATL_G00071440 [Megalops atlanticus]|uniref:Uncharacterized protein n=1 Tax=Megalops atlanticus TaxID=7932 RepID=A0A9D3TER7_MEGAT|nr:hypothetical protein MATL_G00071440 [Megalops atlanticus]